MSNIEIQSLFEELWKRYSQQNSQVLKILELLQNHEKNQKLINDHIAIRTFSDPRVNIDQVAKTFIRLGFEEQGQYHLKAKHVFAKYYKHPLVEAPKVFISELLVDELSAGAQNIICELLEQIPIETYQNVKLCLAGRPWNPSYFQYEKLLQESEYAAWMISHGFQMNHATISINHMKSFSHLEALVEFLQDHDFNFNGEKEGSVIQVAKNPDGEILLKQASTLASEVEVTMQEGRVVVPGCYYEFIERFHDYDGFDPGNASKIMESTNVQKTL